MRKRPALAKNLHWAKGSPFIYYGFTIGGQRFRGSTETKRPEAAEAELARRKVEAYRHLEHGSPTTVTMEHAAARYWDEYASHLKSDAPKYHLRQIIKYCGAGTRLAKVANADAADYVARRRAAVSNASVNREISTWRALWRRARDTWGAAVSDIDWSRHMLPEPPARTRWLRDGQADALIAGAADHLKGPLRFALLTGVRLGNVVGLDWSQIDMHARWMTFRIKSELPEGRELGLPIPDDLFVMLAEMGPRDEGRVFTYRGKPIGKFRRSFRTACKRAGIEDFRFHDLRHTAATWWLRAGAKIEVVQELLGHTSILTTRKYAHVIADDKLAAMENVSRSAKISAKMAKPDSAKGA